ncbi:MAG: exonuclease SbcCD subunit D [Oscillospiraceae bacterium]|nr:exonuclease SbcCD subunit D [Oscillospiraceae bacterium]
MKIIHIADLHLGKSLHGVNLLESGDQPHWVEEFLKLCASRRPQAVLIAGDVYDRGAPAAGAVELLDRLLTGLTELGAAVLLIPGNHDSARRLGFGRSLLARSGLHIAPPLTAPGVLSRVTLEDEYGPVDFWLLPYLFPALAAEALGTELRDYDAAVRAVLAAQPVDFSRRNVILAHQNVTLGGAEPERGGSETMVGGVGQVDASAFDGFDYTALGHIHAGYALGRPEIRYAGSPLCYHFNETKQAAKGPLLVELGPKGAPLRVELLPIRPLHPLRAVCGEYDAIRAAEAERAGGEEYLSVTLTDRRVTPELAEALRSLFAAKGSLLMELSSDWQTALSEGGLSSTALRERGLAELFADFYAQRSGGAEPDEAELALLRQASALAEQADTQAEPESALVEKFLAEAMKQIEN